ncbi:PfkB family carbohydrate kinase [Demequina mangrovi]|uniref:Ribokinase n=1 Tax=Demequina mangrovi TaxID=1043493 RepID=A0A1H6TVN9_9MICO|nr:PfkB family carbohydrate kinase [Demequina mangrovi]SEI84113.1 ribokinase [Demequina mangrovi]
MQRDVTVLGSANADLRVLVDEPPMRGTATVAHDLEMGAGGIGLNQAVAAARMGARTCFIGAIGTDDHGVMLQRCLAESGVEPCVDEVDGAATGAALIALDAGGQITVIELPGANALLDELSDRAVHVLRRTSVLLIQLETALEGSGRAAGIVRASGGTVVLNAAPQTEGADALLGEVDVLVAEASLAASIAGTDASRPEETARALSTRVPAVAVLTEARETVLADASGVRTLPAHIVHGLDMSAVTDTFCGALAAGLATGATLDESAARASAAGALAQQRPGSSASIPTAADVEDFLALERAERTEGSAPPPA